MTGNFEWRVSYGQEVVVVGRDDDVVAVVVMAVVVMMAVETHEFLVNKCHKCATTHDTKTLLRGHDSSNGFDWEV